MMCRCAVLKEESLSGLKQMMKEILFTRKNYKLTEEPGNAKNPPRFRKRLRGYSIQLERGRVLTNWTGGTVPPVHL